MREGSFLYFCLGLYAIMINWYFNHSIIDAILTWCFWPFYLLYALLSGHFANHQWYDIPASYFK